MRPILHFAPHVENFLVIDAAERLSHGCALKAKTLIELLRKRNVPGAKAGWHVLIVGQTEAWVGGTVRDLAGAATLRNFEVKKLPDTTVRQVLRTIAGLEWLATHGDAVSRHVRFPKTEIDQLVSVCSGMTPNDTEQIRPRRARGLIASHLFQTYRYPAHRGRHFSADLWAAELQDHAIGILQLNASSPCRNRTTGPDRAVSAFKRSRTIQIDGPSDQLGCRGSDCEADAHARCGEWIVFASEGQHALAAADPDDESAFREYHDDLTGFGPRWRAKTSYAHEQGNQRDVYAKLLHDFSPLERRDANADLSGTWRNPNTGSRM
jgi:hypothetical protein